MIAESITWIEQNLCEPISVNEVASRSGYSIWHFQKLFIAKAGLAAGEYLRHRRLSRAMKELRFTNKSVLDIAINYQFGSNAAFTRSFKKTFGLSPAEYRKGTRYFLKNYQPVINIHAPVNFTPPEIVNRPTTFVTGITGRYVTDFEVNPYEYQQFSHNCWQKHITWAGIKPDCSITYIQHDARQKNITFTKHIGRFSTNKLSKNSISISQAVCARYRFTGSRKEFYNFVIAAHSHLVNTLNLNVRGTEVIVKILDTEFSEDNFEQDFFDIIVDFPLDESESGLSMMPLIDEANGKTDLLTSDRAIIV